MPFEYVPAGLGTTTNQSDSLQDRNAFLIGGAVVLGLAYWWWKSQRSQDFLIENEGYYNLPEPTTPRRPSGL